MGEILPYLDEKSGGDFYITLSPTQKSGGESLPHSPPRFTPLIIMCNLGFYTNAVAKSGHYNTALFLSLILITVGTKIFRGKMLCASEIGFYSTHMDKTALSSGTPPHETVQSYPTKQQQKTVSCGGVREESAVLTRIFFLVFPEIRL